MQLLLKTLDNEVIEVDAGEDETVRNILAAVKAVWGREKTYRMICAGKVVKEGTLRDYGITGSLPIIVLVTKPNNAKTELAKKPLNREYARIKPEDEEAALKQTSRQYALARQTKPDYSDCVITDSDFSSALQLIMKCNYLFQEDVGMIPREEMMIAVNKKFKDDDQE